MDTTADQFGFSVPQATAIVRAVRGTGDRPLTADDLQLTKDYARRLYAAAELLQTTAPEGTNP